MTDSHAPGSPQSAGSSAPGPRDLPVLRALIDAVDHDLLGLLEKRNALVAEVAEFKRQHALGIRDHNRERELLSDRRDRAGKLGLSTELIESLFRLVLWGSRDRQAALKAEVPLNLKPKTVAIIGGKGGMGSLLGGMMRDLGHAVMIADVNTQLTPIEAARSADVVIVSVPIDETIRVIEQIGPEIRAGALLLDVTSIKREPVAAMLSATQSSGASVVGAHPLFGPGVHSLQGQRVVLCRGRGEEWFDWIRRMFAARGLVVKETTPEDHDRAMAVVQVLTHYSTEVMGLALSRLETDIRETLEFTSPVYLMELLMTARHFGQSPELYGPIQMSNPDRAKVTQAFTTAAGELAEAINTSDRAAFARLFHEARTHLGDFTGEALEKSSFLIDRLVERM